MKKSFSEFDRSLILILCLIVALIILRRGEFLSDGSLTAFIAVITIVWTIKDSNNQLIKKLDHDSNQRDRDRDIALRREIYLNATEAMSKWKFLLSKLCDLDLPQSKIDEELYVISSTLSKVEVVSDNKTIQIVSRLLSELTSAHLELISKRSPLMFLKIDIDVIASSIQKRLAAHKENSDFITKSLLEGNSNQNSLKVAQGNCDHWMKEFDILFKEQEELQKKLHEEHCKFLVMVNEKLGCIGEYAAPALFAIRNELGFPIDEECYIKTLRERTERCGEVLKVFVNDLQKSVREEKDVK